jgi:hypothetical protein
MSPRGGQTPKFGPKKGRNISIMQFRTLRQYQISKKLHLTRSVTLFLQNESQNSGGGNHTYQHPGGSKTRILTKNDPNIRNIGIMQVTSQFGQFKHENSI